MPYERCFIIDSVNKMSPAWAGLIKQSLSAAYCEAWLGAGSISVGWLEAACICFSGLL
jgi:hypothetical protein